MTTGPVTVPFVLAIGIGFSKAVNANEGFGMLTVMSVAPIISVLFTSLVKTPVKKAAATLVRVSKIPLERLSRPLERLSRPLGRGSRPLDRGSRPLDKTSRPLDKTSRGLEAGR